MNYKHGMWKTRFYRIWKNIKARGSGHHKYCKNTSYCKKWGTFLGFREDMYISYQAHCKKYGTKDTSIDRINHLKNYCFKNCRWSTPRVQTRNKKNNIIIEYGGRIMILQDWAKNKNIHPETLRERLLRGWSYKKALETPTNLYHEGKRLPNII